MAEMVRVWGIPGSLLGHEVHPKGFIGYETMHAGSDGEPDHVVPNGLRYRLRDEGEVVRASTYTRNGIRKASITDLSPEDREKIFLDLADAKAAGEEELKTKKDEIAQIAQVTVSTLDIVMSAWERQRDAFNEAAAAKAKAAEEAEAKAAAEEAKKVFPSTTASADGGAAASATPEGSEA